MPKLLVTPSRATALRGELRRFRAVGPTGRIVEQVRWSVSPAYSVDVLSDHPELELRTGQPDQISITATDEDGTTATATLTVISGTSFAPGTRAWELDPLPGLETVDIVQAVPTGDGPDLYSNERGPGGAVIRAVTADGRELWRTGGAIPEEGETGGTPTRSFQARPRSFCDNVAIGMKRDEVVAAAARLGLAPASTSPAAMRFEEAGVDCELQFGPTATVVKKKKVITN